MKNKIFQIGPYPPPYGGISIHIQQLKRLLESLEDIECTAVSYTNDTSEAIPGVIYNAQYTAMKWYLPSDEKYIEHSHLASVPGAFDRGLWAGFYAKSVGSYAISTFHGSDLIKWLIQGMQKEKLDHIKKGFDIVDYLICVNEIHAEVFQDKCNIDPSKIFVIPSYLPSISQSVELPEVFKHFILTHNPIVSSNIQLSPSYGAGTLIQSIPKVLQEFPETGLVIIGKGDKNFIKMAEDLGISSHICFIEKLSHSQIIEVFKHSSFFVRPTLGDSFGLSILEAAEQGNQIIVSDLPSRKCLEKFIPLVKFKPEDSQDLTNKIIDSFRNKIDMSVYQQKIKEFGEENFKKILDLYKKLWGKNEDC